MAESESSVEQVDRPEDRAAKLRPGAYWVRSRVRCGSEWTVAEVSDDGALYVVGDEGPLAPDELDEVGPRLPPHPGLAGDASDASPPDLARVDPTEARASSELCEIARLLDVPHAPEGGKRYPEHVAEAVRTRLARHEHVVLSLEGYLLEIALLVELSGEPKAHEIVEAVRARLMRYQRDVVIVRLVARIMAATEPGASAATRAQLRRDLLQGDVDLLPPVGSQAEAPPEPATYPRIFAQRAVDELELSVAAAHCLRNAGVLTIGQLCQMTSGQVAALRHASRKILRCVEEALENLGLYLADRRLAERSVDELDLTVRAANCLLAGDVRTLDQLCRMTSGQVAQMRNSSPEVARCVERALAEVGLSLASSPSEGPAIPGRRSTRQGRKRAPRRMK